jgi:adenylylsulfate kinase-like enzyme
MTRRLPPRVIWITGLSGAGKSTIARKMQELLRAAGADAVVLDGDDVRRAVDDPHCGHDRASRLTNAYRVCRLAKVIGEQGVPVIVATMSLFHEIHDWNAANLPGYFEVFLRVPVGILRERDPKGLYQRADHGAERDVGGVDLEIEEPRRPDLVVDNSEALADATPVARRIIEAVYGEALA